MAAPKNNTYGQKGDEKLDATIHFRIPSGLKAEWMDLAYSQDQTLTDWIISNCTGGQSDNKPKKKTSLVFRK
jgi:hypothetical protein